MVLYSTCTLHWCLFILIFVFIYTGFIIFLDSHRRNRCFIRSKAQHFYCYMEPLVIHIHMYFDIVHVCVWLYIFITLFPWPSLFSVLVHAFSLLTSQSSFEFSHFKTSFAHFLMANAPTIPNLDVS